MNAADRHLSVPGARLRYRDEGAGRAVVFVHGWTLDLDMWEPQSPLAAQLRMVRFDRRGFGLSSGEPSMRRDVRRPACADHRGSGSCKPLLVGMSQGARVVLDFALRHPSIRRRACCSTAPRPARTPTCPWRCSAKPRAVTASRRSASSGPIIRSRNSSPAIRQSTHCARACWRVTAALTSLAESEEVLDRAG